MIRFRNKKHVTTEHVDLMKSLSDFILSKFFTDAKKKKLEVTVEFKKGLYEKSGEYANCIWEDQHYRPEECTIEIDADQKVTLLLKSLAHELVHVKQWAKGEFYQLQRERKVYKFCGQRYDTDKMDYWDTPWEIEAHGRAIGLVVQWSRENELTHRNLVLEG